MLDRKRRGAVDVMVRKMRLSKEEDGIRKFFDLCI